MNARPTKQPFSNNNPEKPTSPKIMIDSISLALRLWGYTLIALIVLYFFGFLVMAFTAGFGSVWLFGMAGTVTFIGSLPALVAVAVLLPIVKTTNYSREGTLALALLLVTVVCGIPAFIATDMFMNGHDWLGSDAGLLVFPAAALVATWVATIRQQQSVYRYAGLTSDRAKMFPGFSEQLNQDVQNAQ